MKHFKTLVKIAVCMAAVSALSACGGGGSSSTPSSSAPTGQTGKITQGPVKGATVYADSLVAGSGTRFVQDSAEIFAKTDDNGNFQLPTQPTYSHVLVSKGGTDILTGHPAIQMIAPAGSSNVTPLTTLVALDSTGTVQAKIESLLPAGAKFDADISTVTSQAALLLAKSVETSVEAISGAINSGGNISSAQLAAIQTEVMQSVAAELAKPSVTAATMSVPSTLASTMQAAASSAITQVDTQNTNITIPASVVTTASAAVSTAVVSTATAMNVPVNTTATTTQISGGEATIITPAVAASITTAVNAAETKVTTAPEYVAPTVTPPSYTPPPVQVVVAPSVVSTSPVAGASVNGGSAVAISISFSEAMLNDPADSGSAANPVNWLIKAGTTTIAVGAVAYDATSKKFSVTTAAAIPNGANITVTIKKGVKNAVGTGLVNDYSWGFTTNLTGVSGGTGGGGI